MNTFNKLLGDKLNSYNWKFPNDDFEGIETNINVNIERSAGENEYSGMITLSSGLITKNKVSVPLKKDIYYNERDVLFTVDFEMEPDIDSKEPSSIETILRFYIINALGEIFDRLSYTDQKNFKLEGDYYYQQLYQFENLINSAQERKNWTKRLNIINVLKQEKNLNERKLNTFIYNASFFINSGMSNRAKYFVDPIYTVLKSDKNVDKENFYKNNYFALAEIFALEMDTVYLNFLLEDDVAHKSFYSNKLNKLIKENSDAKHDKNELPSSVPNRIKK